MFAEVAEVASEHGMDLPLMVDMGLMIGTFLLLIATVWTAIYMRMEAIRHRNEAQSLHNAHEEHIVDGIEAHDEAELVRMARIIEKILDDQKAAEKVVDDGVPNLRSA